MERQCSSQHLIAQDMSQICRFLPQYQSMNGTKDEEVGKGMCELACAMCPLVARGSLPLCAGEAWGAN